MELTQSVGSCIRSITPKRSIRSNLSLTFGLMVTGTFRGGSALGQAECDELITPVMRPRPMKVSAYLLSVSFVRDSMRSTSFISTQVLRPSTFETYH